VNQKSGKLIFCAIVFDKPLGMLDGKGNWHVDFSIGPEYHNQPYPFDMSFWGLVALVIQFLNQDVIKDKPAVRQVKA
jgi:hypothetical protein